MVDFGTCVVTFLFTDVVGSTRLIEADPAAADRALLRQHALVTGAIERHGGTVFETVGDAVYAAFEEPGRAVLAAAEAQRAMGAQDWPTLGLDGPMRIRVALHRGRVERRGHRYFGITLFAASSLLALGHGGQVLVSDDLATELDLEGLGCRLRPLGRHRLKDLTRPMVVHQLDGPGLATEHPPIRSLGVVHLPATSTPFFGRRDEVRRIHGLLHADPHPARLVTLTGPGGTGKTRLALEAGAGLGEAFPDGVYWVPLAAIRNTDLVLPAIGAAVGAAGDVALHLQTWSALLVLDNLEQVTGCAADLATLLASCPALACLVTSREPLRIRAERVVPVPPLDPAACVHLLRDRVDAAHPDVVVRDEQAAAICAALDRLPLAIELAAAGMDARTPHDLLGLLGDRLDRLGPAGRDAPDRHQTLRAMIAWSVDLLPESLRDLFERLAVFAGSWTEEAAHAVCGAGAADLHDLLDRSLVRLGPDGRWDMLQTIRAFASERLASRPDADAVRSRHAAFYGGLASRLHRALDWVEPGADVRYWDELGREAEDLWAALDHVTGRPPDDTAHRVVAGTWRYWTYRGRGVQMLGLVRRVDWASAPFRGSLDEDARTGLAELERVFGDITRAIDWKRSEALHATPAVQAANHADLADLLSQTGDIEEARLHGHRAVELRRALDDESMVAHALTALALVELRAGDRSAAARTARAATELLLAHPDDLMLGADMGAAVLAVRVLAGDAEGARRAFPPMLAAAVRLRLDVLMCHALELAAAFALADGDARLALGWATTAHEALRRAAERETDISMAPMTIRDAAVLLPAAEAERVAAEARLLPLDAAIDEVVTWVGIADDETLGRAATAERA